MKALDIKRCQKCQGRSFMNGYCLTCESDAANKATKSSRASLADHALASIKRGFVDGK